MKTTESDVRIKSEGLINLRENEMTISIRNERAMVRAMCGVKLMEKKRTEELMEMLGLKETVV